MTFKINGGKYEKPIDRVFNPIRSIVPDSPIKFYDFSSDKACSGLTVERTCATPEQNAKQSISAFEKAYACMLNDGTKEAENDTDVMNYVLEHCDNKKVLSYLKDENTYPQTSSRMALWMNQNPYLT